MKILVTGARGQLGRAIVRRADEIIALDREHLDICDRDAVERAIAHHRPDAVINTAAYTNVDRAELEPELAFRVNRDGAGVVARCAECAGVRLVHLSTDYVFDGRASEPIAESAATNPVNVYGRSKAEGEVLVRAAGGTVVRTSWLFGDGGPSFVHAIAAKARDYPVIRVTDHEQGCPTWTDDLADALIALVGAPPDTYHFANEGSVTRYQYAIEIVAQLRSRCVIEAASYITTAKRPAYSVLSTDKVRALGLATPSWRVGLSRVIENL